MFPLRVTLQRRMLTCTAAHLWVYDNFELLELRLHCFSGKLFLHAILRGDRAATPIVTVDTPDPPSKAVMSFHTILVVLLMRAVHKLS